MINKASAAGSSARRGDIQGLRGISALLVVAFHVWTQRTAGAVDVFFVVSGYLLLGSLMNQHVASGRINLIRYAAGILRRLLPTAIVVLTATVLVSQFLLPETRWDRAIEEAQATALFLENFSLIGFATDYLSRDDLATPFANGWAISTQVQAYFLMAGLMWAVTLIRIPTASKRRTLQLGVLAGMSLVSFAYAVWLVEKNQSVAYFSTFARFWEFAVGGLSAGILANLSIPDRWRPVAGWLGLVMLLSTGWLFGLTRLFPGWSSLWPVAGALLILAAGHGPDLRNAGVGRLLAWRPLEWLGGLSYGIYLWHGPVAVFALIVLRKVHLNLVEGSMVLVLSVALAALAKASIERPLAALLAPDRPLWKVFHASAGMMIASFCVSGAWQAHAWYIGFNAPSVLAHNRNPGALVGPAAPLDASLPVLPRPLHARRDFADVYRRGCHAGDGDATPLVCVFGPADAQVTIAVVGSSHSAHWLPAVQEIARRRSWQVLAYTKSSCMFAAEPFFSDGRRAPDCLAWNEAVAALVGTRRPDLVITLGSYRGGSVERIPAGLDRQLTRMAQAGVPVLLMRDTPWFEVDVPDCVALNSAVDPRCFTDRPKASLMPPSGGWPENVFYVDPTSWLCTSTKCPPVIGNILVYRDKDHLTATFARSLGPLLEPEIDRALGTSHRIATRG